MEDITQTKSCTPHTQLRWTIIFLAWKSHYSDLCSFVFFLFFDRRMILKIAQFFYDGVKNLPILYYSTVKFFDVNFDVYSETKNCEVT